MVNPFSEFTGRILFVDEGNGIFLDVVLVSAILTPILNRKLEETYFPTTTLIGLRDDLIQDKILRWEFARHLWSPVLNYSLDERLGHALYSVLIKLGVAFPLGRAVYSPTQSSNTLDQPPDMLVIMRMRETCDEKQRLIECTSQALRNAPDVVLKWEFDAAGSPYGLVERIIASCHNIGVVERSLCWRYGALSRSWDSRKRFGGHARLFTMLICYDTTQSTIHDGTAHVLTARLIGPLKNAKVMAALRYVASAVVMLSKEMAGVILKGSSMCPRHPIVSSIVYLATPDEV